jgi:hypothetical protein
MKKYLKFFGADNARVGRDYLVVDEISRAESHCVAGFSRKRKPTVFEPNDIMYLARMVKHPNDYVVFGKGIVADSFQLPRDQATPDDTLRIPFRKRWPYYLQLVDTVFINGNLHNGITIGSLIKVHGYNSFLRTQNWTNTGKSIKRAFSNQAYVELTDEVANWLNGEFEFKLQENGGVDEEMLIHIQRPMNAINHL